MYLTLCNVAALLLFLSNARVGFYFPDPSLETLK